MKNLIHLDHNKSYTEGSLLFIDGKNYNLNGIITLFKNESKYKEENRKEKQKITFNTWKKTT